MSTRDMPKEEIRVSPAGVRSLLIVSLRTLDTRGGGEAYTFNTALAVARTGVPVSLIAPVDLVEDPSGPREGRMQTKWVRLSLNTGGITAPVVVPYAEVLAELGEVDGIWVHQYLADTLFFEIAANVAPDQTLLMTSLGCERIRGLFPQYYQPLCHHWFVEISSIALDRARWPGSRQGMAPGAGIWRKNIAPIADGPKARLSMNATPAGSDEGLKICAIGRILPHKCFEVTIEGLPAGASLRLLGSVGDEGYLTLLKGLPRAGQVTFAGAVPEEEKWRVLDDSDVLVASSSHKLHAGEVIDQPELFGRVLLEAMARQVLPVASDIPPFREIMERVGLGDLVYPQRDSAALQRMLESDVVRDPAQRRLRLEEVQERLAQEYLWDTYWSRVQLSAAAPLPALAGTSSAR